MTAPDFTLTEPLLRGELRVFDGIKTKDRERLPTVLSRADPR